jgi:hypothetical protein
LHGRLDYPSLSESEYLDVIENKKEDLLQAVKKLHGVGYKSDEDSLASSEEEHLRSGRPPQGSPKKKTSIRFDLSTTTVYGKQSPTKPRELGGDLSENRVAQRVVKSPVSQALSQGHSALAAALGGQKDPEETPSFWFGLIGTPTLVRYITDDPEEADKL